MKMSSEAIKANIRALRDGRSIVPIQENGLNIPFFTINSFSKMKDLSFYLGDNQPFYCFTPSSTATPRDQEIHKKASICLNMIKEVRPNGPYILSAACLGNLIIFEVAQKLLDQGEQVPVIILFESYRPIALSPTNSIKVQIKILKNNYKKIRNLSPTECVKLISSNFYRKINTLNFLAKKNKPEKQTDKMPITQSIDQDLIENYKGNVVIFKASKPPLRYNNYPDMGWRDYVLGDLKIIEVEGDHTTILEKPNVIDLAAKLNDVLKEYN